MHRAAEVAGVDRYFQVAELTRVEGEGSLHLRVRDGEVVDAQLGIFEPPRYFEKLVVGRTPDEVLDIVARICGICPVAYQMSAVHAFEALFGVEIDPQVRALRRLMYCAEWIESHALHIYLLHAPDFLGFQNAVELAQAQRPIVERGLRLKRAGNRLLSVIGGRPIHPVSVRVGGFSRAPRTSGLAEVRRELDEAVNAAIETVSWVSGFASPGVSRPSRLVALHHRDEYPLNEGRITSNDGLDLPASSWDQAITEEQVAHSTALQARGRDGGVYLLGPTSRITLARDRLHPLAAEALERSGLAPEIEHDIFRSIVARAVELVHATAEARDIIDGYVPPDVPLAAWTPRPGRAAWATEAPRGLLFHRYEVDDRGFVREAQIVPPTSQNQAAIEADLRGFAPRVLDLPHAEATHRLEQLIRSYDPCISCAAHFLDLTVEAV
jgi:sulfhydrogenase subunit alpha